MESRPGEQPDLGDISALNSFFDSDYLHTDFHDNDADLSAFGIPPCNDALFNPPDDCSNVFPSNLDDELWAYQNTPTSEFIDVNCLGEHLDDKMLEGSSSIPMPAITMSPQFGLESSSQPSPTPFAYARFGPEIQENLQVTGKDVGSSLQDHLPITTQASSDDTTKMMTKQPHMHLHHSGIEPHTVPSPDNAIPTIERSACSMSTVEHFTSTSILAGSLPRKRKMSPENKENSRKKQPRIPVAAKRTLEEWFTVNAYPSAADIEEIAVLTDQSTARIKNWFSNARTRKPTPDIADSIAPYHVTDYRGSETSENNCLNSRTRMRLSPENLEKLNATPPPEQQPPLKAYLRAFMENEPADISAIWAAFSPNDNAMNSTMTAHLTMKQALLEQNESIEDSIMRSYAHSARGSTGSRNSAMSMYSTNSHQSFGSSTSRSRRRGRKRFPCASPSVKQEDKTRQNDNTATELPKTFPCTFCWNRSFPNKYEWSRHEESVHVPQNTWVCCPNQPLDIHQCPFCNLADPDDAHLRGHDYFLCTATTEEQRTFHRKDHFIQHLRRVHNRGFRCQFANCERSNPGNGFPRRYDLLDHMGRVHDVIKSTTDLPKEPDLQTQRLTEDWYRPAPRLSDADPALHCGFCGHRSSDWKARSDHVYEHLDNGKWSERDWWPERLDTLNLPLTTTKNTFSCRYLRNASETVPWSLLSRCYRCSWCNFNTSMSFNQTQERAEHVESHRVRSCPQDIFTSWDRFKDHLCAFHGADVACLDKHELLCLAFSR